MLTWAQHGQTLFSLIAPLFHSQQHGQDRQGGKKQMEQPDERPGVNSEGIKQAGGKDERQETEAEVTWMSPNRLI